MNDLPTIDTDVLVVGAGPTGLMAGLVLTRRRVPVVVVDRKAVRPRESRALAVQARTMEIYDQLGLVGTVLARSHGVTRIQIGQGADPRKVSIDAAQQGSTRYPGLHIFEQSRNEELLWSALAETGNDVRGLHRLVDLVDGTDRPDGRVVGLVEGPGGGFRSLAPRGCSGFGHVGASAQTGQARRSAACWTFLSRASPMTRRSGSPTCAASPGFPMTRSRRGLVMRPSPSVSRSAPADTPD